MRKTGRAACAWVLVLASVLLALVACAAEDTSTPPASGNPLGGKASATTEELIALAQKAFQGQDVQDILSLLRGADRLTDEEQRYQAYLGVWQLMRRAYHQQGRTAEQKAALDAVERVAQSYRFYAKDMFKIDK